VARPGFIIPNAADATKSSFIAEPDAGDFDIPAIRPTGSGSR
jgi:hypothetical protein